MCIEDGSYADYR